MPADILPWACNPETYPKIATAVEGGKEYVVWQMPEGFQAAQRTNSQRRIKWHQQAILPTMAEAFYQAQLWAWAAN